MLFHERGKVVNFEIEVENLHLNTVKCCKFLGIWINNRLKWDQHVSKLVLKIKRNMHLLRCSRSMLNSHAKLIIYFAHIQSHISYGLSIWGNMVCDTTIGKIQKLQNKCKYLIYGNRNYNGEILRIVDLIKLENLKFGFKFINDLLPERIKQCVASDAVGKSLVKLHCYNTRNKTTPNLSLCNSNKYLNSILCKGPKLFSRAVANS